MDRIVITIHPAPSDAGLLRVADAMQQVIDFINVLARAERALVSPPQAFDWRLERASTGSPFTVVALAEAANPSVDVAPQVRRVKRAVSDGVRAFIGRGERPDWMDEETIEVARSFFTRNQNGISRTDIDFELGDPRELVSIDRETAGAGIRAIAALNPLDSVADIPDREAFGEVEGLMLAAGRFRGRPAISIRSELYGYVWCVLQEQVIQQFGAERSMADVWRGKTIVVRGRLSYAAGGKLKHIEAVSVRELSPPQAVNLESILDPEFTAGMDPSEYLDKLHAGELG